MSKWLTRIPVFCALALVLAACTSALLKPAPEISVPDGLNTTQVKDSIVHALEGRGWTIDDIGEDSILSTLHLREHTATIRIGYDTHAVQITYLHSSNLEYKEEHGRRYIHRNYNGWIQYLEQDIKRNLQNTNALASN